MSKQENAEYFAERAAAEREMSERAVDERVAAVHHEMAGRYEELTLQCTRGSPPLQIVQNDLPSVELQSRR